MSAALAGCQSPGWPDDGRHFHLDFGAGEPDWTALTDPEGRPFCLLAEH